MNPEIHRRLLRIARIVHRTDAWIRHAALMDKYEAEDTDAEAECGEDLDTDACGMDDGAAPAGPRTEKNKSRYHLEPGHGQHLSDLLQSTARARHIKEKLRNLIDS